MRGSDESVRSGKNIYINASAGRSTNDMDSRLTSIAADPSEADSPQSVNILK
tara:strand:- start:60 stop:215 length:156 start_codon:yes stop_codon:yes gene_type:complete